MKTDKPQQLYAESTKVFRLRAILWLLANNPSITYDELSHMYCREFRPDQVTKDSIVRDLHILHQRDHVIGETDERDHRRLVWSVA